LYDILTVYLENGLRVIMHKIPHVKTMACGLWVKQGSKNENDENNGLSHLLEHLMINIDNCDNKRFKNLINEVSYEGVAYNAGTTKEFTSYYFTGLARTLRKCIETLSSIAIDNKTFSKELLENEKKVVSQETISFYSSFNQIKERTSQALWGNTGTGRIIVGSIENVKNANIGDIEKIINEAYTPENSTLIVIGGINYEKTLEMIEENFSQWGDRKTKQYKEVVDSDPGIYFNSVNNGKSSAISVGFRLPSYTHEDRLNIEVLSTIVGNPTMESRLSQEIRQKRGLAYSLGSFTNFYENRGTLGFTAVCAHESVDEVVKIMINEFLKIKEKGFNDIEVNRAKRILETRTLLDTENVLSHLRFLGKCSSYGKLFSLEQEVRKIQNISKENVDRVATEILNETNIGLAAIGNFDIDTLIPLLKIS
jgi:predicted Zn-dependent peptidase